MHSAVLTPGDQVKVELMLIVQIIFIYERSCELSQTLVIFVVNNLYKRKKLTTKACQGVNRGQLALPVKVYQMSIEVKSHYQVKANQRSISFRQTSLITKHTHTKKCCIRKAYVMFQLALLI